MTLPFKFITGPADYCTRDVFFARVNPDILMVDPFIESLYHLLWFPGYFGFNWNAFYDCLCDFNWMPNKKIVLVHDVIPGISKDNLYIYLKILRDAVAVWQGDDVHQLEIVFQEKDRGMLEAIFKEIDLNKET